MQQSLSQKLGMHYCNRKRRPKSLSGLVSVNYLMQASQLQKQLVLCHAQAFLKQRQVSTLFQRLVQ